MIATRSCLWYRARRHRNVRAAACRTGGAAPGPDGVPCGWRRRADRCGVASDVGWGRRGGGRPEAFGALISTMLPKVDVTPCGDTAAVRVANTRPLACGDRELALQVDGQLADQHPLRGAYAGFPEWLCCWPVGGRESSLCLARPRRCLGSLRRAHLHLSGAFWVCLSHTLLHRRFRRVPTPAWPRRVGVGKQHFAITPPQNPPRHVMKRHGASGPVHPWRVSLPSSSTPIGPART